MKKYTVFKSRIASSGSFYQLISTASFQWTNDPSLYSCLCKMQYVRVYTDYAPSQQDQFTSLALMNPESNYIFLIDSTSHENSKLLLSGTLFIFHFQVNTTVNNNQTVSINYSTNTTSGSLYGVLGNLAISNLLKNLFKNSLGTSQSDTVDDPVIGAWNILNCRTNSFFTLSLNQQNANGTVVGFDIYPYPGTISKQTIFSFRDSGNLEITFTFEIFEDGTLTGASCCGWTIQIQTSATVNWSKLTIFKHLSYLSKLFRCME